MLSPGTSVLPLQCRSSHDISLLPRQPHGIWRVLRVPARDIYVLCSRSNLPGARCVRLAPVWLRLNPRRLLPAERRRIRVAVVGAPTFDQGAPPEPGRTEPESQSVGLELGAASVAVVSSSSARVTNASTTSGSNWLPAQARSSFRASGMFIGYR